MISQVLVSASAAIILLLGSAHLIFTFSGSKLTPRDGELRQRMSEGYLFLTHETTVWKAWVGFNGSHSFGAILFGLVFGYLAMLHPVFLFNSGFLLAVGFGFLASFLWLARLYWFSAPFRGILLSLILYVLGILFGLGLNNG